MATFQEIQNQYRQHRSGRYTGVFKSAIAEDVVRGKSS
jgi:hypothetical protein